MIRRSIAGLGAALLVCPVALGTLSAQKKKESTNWPCRVEMRDAATDAIRSDGGVNRDGTADYVNGVDGVTCVIVPPDAGSLSAGDLSLYFTGRIRRALVYTEQNGGSYPGYPQFEDTGSLRVKQLGSVAGSAEPRAFIAYSAVGRFVASAEGADDGVTDLVSVQRLDACTWHVRFDGADAPTAGHARMELWDGRNWERFRGVLQMPFALVVRATGGIPGCAP